MFSSRLSWSLKSNRLSQTLEAKRAAGVRILDLTESNPTRAAIKYDEPAILHALSKPASLQYEPDLRGLVCAREAIAEYYQSHQHSVSPDSLHLTASTSEGYAFLFKLLADPGQEVLVPRPGYPLFDFLSALDSVRLVHYPLAYYQKHGWQIDMDSLATSISTETVGVIVVNPNNPTGAFVKPHEIEHLNELCIQHDMALIADEVFLDYPGNRSAPGHRSLVSNRHALTFVLSGLSKVAGLPQMKLGWIHVSGPEAQCAEAQERLDFIADTYLSVGAPVQHAAPELLSLRHGVQQQIKQRTGRNEARLRQRLSSVRDCRVLKREGGWYAVLESQHGFSREDFAVRLLEEKNVLAHPGYFFDFPHDGFLVVSLLTPEATLEEGLARIVQHLNASKKP